MLEDRCLIAANRLDCSHRDPCDRRKRKLETSSQLPLPSNNDPVCCFLPEGTAMVQNFMTRDTWTGDVDETVSVHNRSDPQVSEIQSVHMQSSATRQPVQFRTVPESCLFPLLFRRSRVPPAGKQAGKTVVVPDEERTTSFFSKDSLQACLLCRLCGP
jgi:hypothetical protein